MKTLIFISTFLLSLTSFAELRILDGGDQGPSRIDPVNYGARLAISQTVPGNLGATYACPPLKDANDPAKGRVPNIFKIMRLTADCKVETVKQIGQGLNCDDIKKDPKVIDCTGVAGLEVILSEPTGVAAGTEVKSTKDINLASDELKNAIKNCSPNGEFLAIRTPENPPKGIVASLQDKSSCSLDNRRVSFDAVNDQTESAKLGLFTSSLGGAGFRIGRHTNYYFDFASKQWCMYFMDAEKRENDCRNNVTTNGVIQSSCGLNNAQINLDFDLDPSNDGKNINNQGVVKLTVDANGKPIAYVGKGTAVQGKLNGAGNQFYDLNPETPVMKIELTQEGNGSISTNFQQLTKVDGSNVGGALMVTPQYSYGDQFSAGNCSAGSCFNSYPTLFQQASDLDAKSCAKNTFPVDILHGQAQCYSCNGVTPGKCNSPSGPLMPENYRAQLNTMNQCLNRSIQPTITPAAQ